MEIKDLIISFLKEFEMIALDLDINYLGILFKEETEEMNHEELIFDSDKPYISLETLKNSTDFDIKQQKKTFNFTLKSGINEIFCHILPIEVQSSIEGFAVFQSINALNEAQQRIVEFSVNLINTAGSLISQNKSAQSHNDKYKSELRNMRDINAKLFPKFENIENLDIASAYLPADLMTGNFIDGFFIDDDLYQIVACDVSGYDAASSLAGAAIRTLVRSEASTKGVPSAMIETIIRKVKHILTGINALIYLSIYQINIRTGKATISSYGDITTLFYNKKKNGFLSLKDTKIGQLLSKRNFYKDISFMLSPNDSLLFYSNGVISAPSEDGEALFGETKLKSRFVQSNSESSVDRIHGMIEDIYEFTNYSPLEKDVILICIKMQ